VVDIVAVVVQIRDDLRVHEIAVELHIVILQQRLPCLADGRKHRLRPPLPDDLVPEEDAVRGQEEIEFRVRMLCDPPFRHRQIGGHIVPIGICGQLLRRNLRPVIVLQGGDMVPPLIPVPGESLVDGVALSPVVGEQGVGAVIQRILVQQILDVIQRIGVVEIVRHGRSHTALIPDQGVHIQAEDHPLRLLGPKEDVHHLVELAVIPVRDGEPHRGGAEGLLNPAGAVVGRHGGAHQHGVRLHILRQARRLVPLIEQHRLPLVRHPIIQAGIHHVHNGSADRQQRQNTRQKAADPASICLLHTALLRSWNR